MRARTIAALAAALLLGGSALAAAAARRYPTGAFAVAGTPVAPAHILDARALPDMAGRPAIMVTLDARTAAAVAAKGGGTLPVTLDGKPLGTSPASALADGHVVQVSGDYGGYDGASALARRISGRDPLPETDGDE